MDSLISEIKQCTICAKNLEHNPRPIISVSPYSRIAIIGQAPGRIVHNTGIPWDDASGNNLRDWLGVNKEEFYNDKLFALIPMGFCFPGTGKSGDLPPRPECAPLWHQLVFDQMKKVKLTLLVGQYAQKYYLGNKAKRTLTETVQHYNEYLPEFLPLPHPSPRNNIWQKKNPWFKEEVLPILQSHILPNLT